MEPIVNAPNVSPTPDTQSTKQLSSQELCQEADGLFAGITYLNQTEQTEDDVFDVDDDEEEEEDGLAECCMVPESGKKEAGFVLTELPAEDDPNPSVYQKSLQSSKSSIWASDKCLLSCWDDDDCCKLSQQKKTSNCPAYLLCHWIEVHGETTVMSKDGQSLAWLCPVPSCGSYSTSKPDLLRHVRDCNQIATLNGFYWCNEHDSFEAETFYRTCDSSRHQRPSQPSQPSHDHLSTDFKILIYKFIRSWPGWNDSQPDPQFCQHCKDPYGINLFTPKDVIDHVLGHHRSSLPPPFLTSLQCLDDIVRSNMQNVGRSDPMMAEILDFTDARYMEHLITKFTQFLEAADITADGLFCCGSPKWVFGGPYWFSIVPVFHLDDLTSIFKHYLIYHTDLRPRYLTMNRLQQALDSPHLQNSFRCLKHRQELLRVVKQLQEEVNGTRESYQYLLTTAGTINEVRVPLMIDIGTLLASLESQLRLAPTTPLPQRLYEDLQRAEKLFDEFFASPDFMDISGLGETTKLSAHINEERRKLKAMLGRMSSLDKSDQMSPRDKQWANLRSLRFSSSMFHSQILFLTGREGRQRFGFRQRVVIRRLRQQIKSSSDFLVTGILTFRSVLQGSVPSTLEEVLAFVSLAHVMSEELWFKGRMAEPLNFYAGFPGWMRAIRNKAEQAAFQELATRLWPGSALAFESEVKPTASFSSTVVQSDTIQSDFPVLSNQANEISATDMFDLSDDLDNKNFAEILEFPQSSSALETPYLDAFTSDLPVWNDVPPDILHHSSPLTSYMDLTIDTLPYFEDTVQQLLGQSIASDDFHFSDFLDIRHWENSPGRTLVPTPSAPVPATDSEARIVEVEAEAEAELAPSYADTVSSTVPSDSLDDSLQSKELIDNALIGMEEVEGGKASERGFLAILCATAIFQTVLTYMNYLCGLGDLLTYLAGNLSMRRNKSAGSSSPSSKEKDLLILVKILHPLLTFHELGTLKYVVGMTSAALQQGFFTCLHEVEDYLVHLGRLFAQSKHSYMLLVSKSLKYMRTAALETSSSTHPCACGTGRGIYTGKEIKVREAEQALWASERFSDCYDRNGMGDTALPTWSPAIELEGSPYSSVIISPFSSIQTWESGSSSLSREVSASASAVHIPPGPELAGTVRADTLHCDMCRTTGTVKNFSGPDAECNLRRHIRERHEDKKFLCPSCHAPFSRLHNLRTHWTRKHKGLDMPASLEKRVGGRHASYLVSPY